MSERVLNFLIYLVMLKVGYFNFSFKEVYIKKFIRFYLFLEFGNKYKKCLMVG